MRARVTALAAAVLALASFVAAARSRPAEAEAAALAATGDAQVGNSRDGSAILAGSLGPGDSLAGTVTISNIGSAAGGFSLSLSHLTDTPGPRGGFFSRTLDLAVDDVTNPAAPVAIYRGALNSLNPTALGSYSPGAAHTYRFVVSWAPGAADATMYGSSMSVEFDWSASTDAGPAPPPDGTPNPPPAPSASGGVPSPTFLAPKLGLTLTGRQPVVRQGGVRVALVCDEDCAVVSTGAVQVAGAARAYRLVPARRSAKGGQKLALKLKLPASGRPPLRAALRVHRRAVASVKISATSAGGEATVAKRKVRVIG